MGDTERELIEDIRASLQQAWKVPVEYFGSGSYGYTFRTQKPRGSTAIKVFKQNVTFPERVDREPKALKKVDSPNVARYVDDSYVRLSRGLQLRFLEYVFVNGSPVSDLLTSAPFPREMVLPFAVGVLNGLSAIHAHSMAHRDLSTNNIILADDRWDSPVIIDLGWARHIDLSNLTVQPQHTGTTQFMAPEQLLEKHGNPASDLWALGVTLYWLLEGRHPYIDDALRPIAPVEALFCLKNNGMYPMARTDGGLVRFVTGLLSLEPYKRGIARRLVREARNLPMGVT